MTGYRVSFFNELTNSRGTLYKVCQRSVEIRTARSLDRAVEAAKKRFARLEHVGEWRLHARLFEVEPPRPRIEAVRSVDMAASNAWAEFAALFRSTRSAFLDHERAKTELKGLMPEDAKEAFGHGVRAKRSKTGAVSFEVIETVEASEVEASDAPVK